MGTTVRILKHFWKKLKLHVTVFRQVPEILYLLKAVACVQSMGAILSKFVQNSDTTFRVYDWERLVLMVLRQGVSQMNL